MARFFEEGKCPICGAGCTTHKVVSIPYYKVECERCGTYLLKVDSFQSVLNNDELLFKLRNLIYSIQIAQKSRGTTNGHYLFYYSEKPYSVSDNQASIRPVNLLDKLPGYPNLSLDRLTFVLLNLYHQDQNLGHVFDDFDCSWLSSREHYHGSSNFDARIFCCLTDDRQLINKEIHQMLTDLSHLKYIDVVSRSDPNTIDSFTISLEGRIVIEKNLRAAWKQGFIAIKFSIEADEIVSAIKQGISDADYNPRRISDKEYNGQIVPEIFFEIGRSSFVVMDSTYPNKGAYYEAGYAKGMNIPVIFTCRKDVFDNIADKEDRPHFDIQQENHILWTDENDLTERLKKRIEATIDLKQKKHLLI